MLGASAIDCPPAVLGAAGGRPSAPRSEAQPIVIKNVATPPRTLVRIETLASPYAAPSRLMGKRSQTTCLRSPTRFGGSSWARAAPDHIGCAQPLFAITSGLRAR